MNRRDLFKALVVGSAYGIGASRFVAVAHEPTALELKARAFLQYYDSPDRRGEREVSYVMSYPLRHAVVSELTNERRYINTAIADDGSSIVVLSRGVPLFARRDMPHLRVLKFTRIPGGAEGRDILEF